MITYSVIIDHVLKVYLYDEINQNGIIFLYF